MIEILQGTHETVSFKTGSDFRFHDNTDNEEYPAHWHTELEIIMPVKNIYTAIIDNHTYVLREGDILIIGSGVLHHLLPQEGQRFILQPSFNILRGIKEFEPVLTRISPVLLITPESAPEIHERIRTLIVEMKQEYFEEPTLAEAAIYYRLIEMFVLIGRRNFSETQKIFEKGGRKNKEYSEKFITVCRYIDDHCTEDISLEDAASVAGFSKYHFERLFKSFTGTTFYKYLNQKRIAHAEMLLVDPDISITEVALHSGFNNLSSFIRMFKLTKGYTPTEFRNLYG